MMAHIKKHIPNFITSLGLTTGLIAMYFAMMNDVKTTLLLLLLASVFDFLDGAVARILHVMSPMGKELDSLSDMLVFGLVPGVALHTFAFTAMGLEYPLALSNISPLQILAILSPILIVVFSALRLAKFNIDDSQTYYFKGLPTPANALLLVSLIMIFREYGVGVNGVGAIVVLLSVLSATMLVAPIKLFSLKFKTVDFSSNWYRYLILAVSLVLILFLGLKAFALIIVLFVFLSIVLGLMGAFESKAT